MAIQTITYNGTVNSNSQYISYYVVYELLSQNVGLNQSTVRATAYVKTGNWDFSSSNINKSITIDGQKTEQLHVSLNQGRNATTNLISLTKTITHKDDGTRSFSIQAHLNCYAGGYGPGSNCNVDSGTITLPTIPRASSISGTINPQAGDPVSVTINRHAGSFTHKLDFKVGTTVIKSQSGIGTSHTFTFTDAETANMVKAISGSQAAATIVCTTYNGSTQIGSPVSLSGTVYRSPSTASASLNVTLGSNTAVTLSFPVTISRKSASYTHTLTLKTGNTTLATATGVGTTHSFSVSTLALYRACPGALSQALILTCETKRGSATIGTASASGTLTLLLANCRPTLTSYASGGFTFYDANDTTAQLVSGSTGPGASTTVVDGYSNIRIEVPAAKLATSSYGASISRYELEAGDKKITVSPPAAGQPLVGTLTGVTGSLVKVTAYDSRGNSVSQSASAGHVAYQKPTFQSLQIVRQNRVDTKATLNCGVKWYSSAIGQTTNTLSVRYSYKKTSATSWSSPQTIVMNYTTNWASYNGLLNGDLGAGGFDADNSYDIKLECQDRLAGWVTIQLTLDRGIPTVHMTKNGLAIGKLHSSGALDVNGDIYCKQVYPSGHAVWHAGNLPLVDYVIERGTNGIWRYEKWANGKIELWTNSFSHVISFEQLNSNLYYNGFHCDVPLTTNIDYVNGGVTNWHYANWTSVTIRTEKQISFRYYSVNTTENGRNTTFSAHVIGRWK